MDKENVIADVLTKIFLCGSDVTDESFLHFSLVQDKTRGHGNQDLHGSRAGQ